MKKILVFGLIILAVFLIYLCNLDKKVYYLALGDNQNNQKSYSTHIKDYLKKQKLLETYVKTKNTYRTTDLINKIKQNKKINHNKKEITMQNALIKADLVTLSIENKDIIEKIEKNDITNKTYNYIDDLTKDLDKLLSLTREYCKEDIIMTGYYNPYPKNKQSEKIINYLNKKYKETSKKYNVIYVEIDTLFKENPAFINDKSTKDSSKAISGEIIGRINKTLLKSWFLQHNLLQ